MSIAAAVFNVFVCMVLPLGVLVALLVRRRGLAFSFVLGVATFLVSQVFTRIPLLTYLKTTPGFVAFSLAQPALVAVLVALSAGVFEEGGRYVAMTLARRHRTYADALAFGMGHGGVEAVLVGLNSLYVLVSRPDILAANSPGMIALSGIERLLAMTLHIGLSVLVMHAVAHKKPLWLGVALLLHTLVDAAVGLFPLWGLGFAAIEGWLALCTLVTAVLALGLRRAFRADAPQSAPQKEVPHEEGT